MKKRVLFAVIFLSFASIAGAFEPALPALTESQAYKLYTRQPKSELSKLLYLMNRFKEGNLQVVYNGQHYASDEAFRIARDFLRKNYKKESAEYWIKKYCTRTDKGSVILFKDAKNQTRPAADAAMEELKNIQKTGK